MADRSHARFDEPRAPRWYERLVRWYLRRSGSEPLLSENPTTERLVAAVRRRMHEKAREVRR